MCARGFKCLLESMLLLLLGGQTLLLLALTYRGYWEIPSWFVEYMLDRKIPSSLSVELGSVRYYPGKGLEILDLELHSEECRCPLMTVGNLLVVPSEPTLEMGKSESAVGLLSNAVVYYPDPFLPASENLQLIKDLTLRFHVDGEGIELESLKAKLSRLTLASRNVLRLRFAWFQDQRTKPGVVEFPTEVVFQKLRELRYLYDAFEHAEKALLTLSFDSDPDPQVTPSAALSLYAASARILDRVNTQGVFLEGRIVWEDAIVVEDKLRGEIQSVRYEQELQMDELTLAFTYLRDGFFSLLPDEVGLQAAKLSFRGQELDFLEATIWPERTGQGEIAATMGFAGESTAIEAAYDIPQEWMGVQVSGDFDALHMAATWTQAMQGFSLFGFEDIPHLRASFEIREWQHLSPIEFRAVGTSILAKGVNFEYGRTWGRWDGTQQRIVLDQFVGQRSGYTLSGSLDKTLGYGPYRYRIFGQGIPTDLNPMFRSWWSAAWEDFDFREHPVQVDLDIWGLESDPGQRFVHGMLGFEHLDYKGLDIERGQVRLNSVARYLQLLDLVVKTPDGVASGDVSIVYDPLDSNMLSEHLDLYTNLPLHRVAPLVGDDLQPLVENTRPDTVADVWLHGVLVKEAFPEYRHLDSLKLRVQVRRPTWFYGFEIDGADAFVHKQQDRVEIHPVDLRFAGGRGNAFFVGYEEGGLRQVDFAVDLRDFDFRSALSKVEGLQEEAELEQNGSEKIAAQGIAAVNGEPAESSQSSVGATMIGNVPEGRSFMNVRLAGSSPADSLDGLQAWGEFDLNDPLIHRVHLFGGISKAFSNAELSVGSFSLKEASSPLRVEGKRIIFEDLELTGPSSRVRSKGVVDLEDGSLDFRLKAYPLGEVKFPVVAGLALILRPFAHMFEMQLTGTLKEPEWKLVIDPSGL